MLLYRYSSSADVLPRNFHVILVISFLLLFPHHYDCCIELRATSVTSCCLTCTSGVPKKYLDLFYREATLFSSCHFSLLYFAWRSREVLFYPFPAGMGQGGGVLSHS